MKYHLHLLAILALSALTYSSAKSAPFTAAEEKFSRITANAAKEKPNQTPTNISDSELNAYLNEGGVKLPQGVERVNLSSAPGVVTGTAHVDFDQLTAGRRSRSMWMMLFNGTHDVKVVANAKGEAGVGDVHVRSVELDGADVPRPALEFLVDRFLKPKYGDQVGLDSIFKLPARIDNATVGKGEVTLMQK